MINVAFKTLIPTLREEIFTKILSVQKRIMGKQINVYTLNEMRQSMVLSLYSNHHVPWPLGQREILLVRVHVL